LDVKNAFNILRLGQIREEIRRQLR
jgi:hypothetical protein